MDKKLCPMKFEGMNYPEDFYCEEKKCAWWDETHKECSFLIIGNSLFGIKATLNRAMEELIKGGKL